jgi:molybdopterin-guanine dinucleotide biosynthesis protein A
MTSQTKVTGVILAGGQARRMNYQDKGLQLFRRQPLISYSFNALRPIVDDLIINANRNVEVYETFGVPVISDLTPDFSGALAGILAAMNYSKANLLLVVPCDAPFITTIQLQHLLSEHQKSGAEISVACAGAQIHSVFLVIKTNLKTSLETYLAQGERKVRNWFELHKTHYVDFGENASGFENINTLEELITI